LIDREWSAIPDYDLRETWVRLLDAAMGEDDARRAREAIENSPGVGFSANDGGGSDG